MRCPKTPPSALSLGRGLRVCVGVGGLERLYVRGRGPAEARNPRAMPGRYRGPRAVAQGPSWRRCACRSHVSAQQHFDAVARTIRNLRGVPRLHRAVRRARRASGRRRRLVRVQPSRLADRRACQAR
jgi:hypothetical protein